MTELARDIAMQFPDDIWRLDGVERYLRCRTFSEFCTLDESRYFLRAILPVPIEDGDAFCWGVWVEVSRQDHDRYLKAYSADELSELEPIKGCLANELPVYEESLGAPVRLMPSADQRPDVVVLQEGLLATEQQVGITLRRLEEINEILFGAEPGEDEEF